MAEPQTGPCDTWIEAADVFDCSPCSDIAVGDQDAALAAEAAEAASSILYALSGWRYPGVCTDTVRPCARCEEWPDPPGWHGSWGQCRCQSPRSRGCGCPGMDEVRLGGIPVIDVTQVRVDGTVLTEGTHYRLDDYGWLVRIDGEGWLSCQDLSLAATEAGTWDVTFTYGRTPPADGVMAAKRLACELYQACATPDNCVLSKQVQSIVRQGVEIGVVSPQDLLEEGRTGLYVVDLFLGKEDRARKTLPSVVASPDALPRVRRTAT